MNLINLISISLYIVGYKEIGRKSLSRWIIPIKTCKNYMTFSVELLDIDLSVLVNLRLIEKLMNIDPKNSKGKPAFMEP